jgi:hypothetical protein
MVGFSGEAHDGGEHGSAVEVGSVFADVDVGGADLEGFAGAQDAGAGDQFVAIGGCQEVQLVFDGEDGGIGGHEGIGGVAAGAVGEGSGNSSVKIAVLLGEFGTEGNANGHVAGRQFGKLRSQVLHQSLAPKTVADLALIVGVGNFEAWMFGHEGEYSSAGDGAG